MSNLKCEKLSTLSSDTIIRSTLTKPSAKHSLLLHSLPLELRLQIYAYLLPPSQPLRINHCTHLSEARLPTPCGQPRPSPLSRYLTSRCVIAQWCRSHGLHLPLVCRQLRDEVFDIMRQQGTKIEGHCVGCLGRVMRCLREEGMRSAICSWDRAGNGDGPILKEWWFRVTSDGSIIRRHWWERPDIVKIVEKLREVVESHFGRVGLVTESDLRRRIEMGGTLAGSDRRTTDEDCRFWYNEGTNQVKSDREFVVEHVNVIGRMHKSMRRRRRDLQGISTDDMNIDDGNISPDSNDEADEDDQDDGAEDDNDNDNDITMGNNMFPLLTNPPHFSDSRRRYANDSAITEVARQNKRYHVDRHEEMIEISRMVRPWQVFLREGDASGWWRESRMLEGAYGRGRGWVMREEIWVGCLFR